MYLGQWVCLPVGLSLATCYSQRKWKVEAVADGNVVEEEAVEAGYGSDGTWCRCRWLPRWQGQPSPGEPAVSFETVECKWPCWPNLDNSHGDDTRAHTAHTASHNGEPPPRKQNKQTNRQTDRQTTTEQRVTRKKKEGREGKLKTKGLSYRIKTQELKTVMVTRWRGDGQMMVEKNERVKSFNGENWSLMHRSVFLAAVVTKWGQKWTTNLFTKFCSGVQPLQLWFKLLCLVTGSQYELTCQTDTKLESTIDAHPLL